MESDMEKGNGTHRHCGFTLIKDPPIAVITPSNEMSDEKTSSSDSTINIHPRDSAESPLAASEINILDDTSLSTPLVKDTGIHLPCNSLLIQGPRPVFLAQVPGIPQIKADEHYPHPRISRAGKDALKTWH